MRRMCLCVCRGCRTCASFPSDTGCWFSPSCSSTMESSPSLPMPVSLSRTSTAGTARRRPPTSLALCTTVLWCSLPPWAFLL
uniref:Uncharacterized protein n=1 Tax=Anguilla anguilla TaxID=7936 RepID=A0A0E9QKV3_ANGAN